MTASVFRHRRAAGTGILLSADSFDRTDSTTNLGSTDGAGARDPLAWVQNVGTWGITSNTAYTSASVNQSTATIDFGTPDVDIHLTLAALSDCGITFRFTTFADCWLVRYQPVPAQFQLIKRASGSGTVVGHTDTGNNGGDVYRVVAVGSSITAFRNGIALHATNDAFNKTVTKHGLYSGLNTTGRLNDWSASTP